MTRKSQTLCSLAVNEQYACKYHVRIDYCKNELYTKEEFVLSKGKSNAGYHYLGSAKIIAQIGKVFAEAIGEIK